MIHPYLSQRESLGSLSPGNQNLAAIYFRVDRERFTNLTSRAQHHATECRDLSQDAFCPNHMKYGGKLMAASSISLNFLPRPLRKALLDFQKEGVKFGIRKQGR